ncbi:alpha/beta hydrolase [Metabacillus sp. B2-18]|uniref:alpha/beta hydrolase n=1 Tax=Metabacillus sp. B2-18 TaxID=2897333 RepID=UPI001E3E759A|nr:alpha/beta hydrolase [Metabacillus sp. B2-18]UGB28988.1 alpha/beta hydrolase [Metabacillus sp. B2-18]
MTLHPQVIALLQHFEKRNVPSVEQQNLQEARALYVESSSSLNITEEIHHVEDREIPGYEHEILIRIYSPSEKTSLPALVYFHGGGWVIGNIETHDSLCRLLANHAQCKVISVEYGLAPEYKFPVPVEDAYLATKWVYDHADDLGIDQKFIAVGGDSAGGNLAAVTCYLAVQRKDLNIGHQLLFYPSTGFEPTESYEKYGEGYYLTKSTMNWFREQYLSSISDTQSPLAAPMLIPENDTAKLPPAYIVTAEYDPLCDGGEAYSRKLSQAGVQTTYACYPGMIHGFMCMTLPLEDGRKAIYEAAEYLKNQYQKQQVT